MTDTVVGPTIGQRWHTIRWVLVALAGLIAISTLTVYLTAPRPGARMDPAATSDNGAHALVALSRDRGVDVVEATGVDDAVRAMRPDALLLVAQTRYPVGDDALHQLAELPGDRLLIEPSPRVREALAPLLRRNAESSFGGEPDCALPAARRAGDVELGVSDTYEAIDDTSLEQCYGAALVSYSDRERTITVVGTADFMTNGGLLRRGNAALALNLTGPRQRLVWFAPQSAQGAPGSGASLTDLIPDRVTWIVLQLGLAVGLVALWRARRIGPLIAEDLPVVVRASETVEGRGRLYRSRRARDRAAAALRTATLQRTVPRLGLGAQSEQTAVVQAVAHRTGDPPAAIASWLYGPTPATDADLVALSRHLDQLERQVAHS